MTLRHKIRELVDKLEGWDDPNFDDKADEATDAILKAVRGIVPDENDTENFFQLEEDSPELALMLGWNKCRKDILDKLV